MISTPLFACFYLFFVLLPIVISAARPQAMAAFRKAYAVAYACLAALLTLPRVSLTARTISFSFSLLPARLGLDFSFYSLFLNAALSLPLGFLLANKSAKSSCIAGLGVGAFIELCQLLAPFGRVVDALDIVFICLAALISRRAFRYFLGLCSRPLG